jgi:protein PhnA
MRGLSPRIQTPHPPSLSRRHLFHKGRRKKDASILAKNASHGDQDQGSNGAQLADGDTVTLTKDLRLKGSSTVLKRGTVIKNIHLTGDPDEIEARTDKVKGLVPRTEFFKKA